MSERLSNNWSKRNIFSFQVKTVTLTVGQGHPMSHNFEGFHTGHLLAKSHNSTMNSVGDIVKKWIFYVMKENPGIKIVLHHAITAVRHLSPSFKENNEALRLIEMIKSLSRHYIFNFSVMLLM